MQICKNIKQIRDSKGISVTDVAKELGIPRTSYGNYENETEPDIDTLKRIAAALGVHYVQIIDGPGFGPPEIPKEEDFEMEVTFLKSELEKVRFSLNEIDSIFLRVLASGKDKRKDLESGLIGGKKQPRQAGAKKQKQKDNDGNNGT